MGRKVERLGAMKRTNLAYCLLAALAITLANSPLCAQNEQPIVTQPRQVWLTFFVHGIMSIQPHLTISNFLRFMRDDVENTTYAKTVEIMRQDPHFYQNQAMQGFGLHRVDKEKTGQGEATSALAKILDEVTLLSHGPSIENHYYTYGWSGLLSPTNRYKDAFGLYNSIQQEIQQFKKQGITPKIRVIGYSHGGNVVLNLGAVRQKMPVDKNLVIDEAVLLGVPIQKETDYLVNDDVFKRVYNIYSNSDRIQKLDFFSYTRLFSRRIFEERTGFKLPKKLVQIQLKLTRSSAAARSNPKKFKLTLNMDNPAIVSGKSHLLRNSSPGHAELWAFGWSPTHYRQSFALNPLPTVAILPFILKSVQDIEDQLSPKYPVIVDMRPEHGITLIKNVKKNKFYTVVKFIPRHDFKRMQAMALEYAPEGFTVEAYKERIRQSYIKAHEFYQDEWSLQARLKRRNCTKKQRKQLRKAARLAAKESKRHEDALPCVSK